MLSIPFALPLIDDQVVAEVLDTLTNTGWLTTGPKVRQLEEEVKRLCGVEAALCVNSWTSGAMLALRWFGIGPGDEVIVPAYTYSATALCALNIGAKVVMVDVGEDFNILPERIAAAIGPHTKAVLPVDIGGWPCDYDAIMEVVNSETCRKAFVSANERQQKLGRPLVLADAAHSIGATYKGRPAGVLADITVFSFHSVKNVTTGEGGIVCLHLPAPFDNQQEYQFLKIFALNGQTKSAFEKNQPGAWRYDIIAQGLKINMPDICAAIGLAQIKRYPTLLLPERKRIFERYNQFFGRFDWAELPPFDNDQRTSSYHLYPLRIRNISETQRDAMIESISEKGVGVNVHYIPMPMLTLFKEMGYRMEDYPQTYLCYLHEISLPIYNGLSNQQVDYVAGAVEEAFWKL